jgi:ferritin
VILKPEIEKLINDQIGAEQYAHVFYKALADWADLNAFPGLKGWAENSSQEELTHAQLFIDYLNDRGKVVLGQIIAPPNEYKDYLAVMQAALKAEQAVSAHLELLSSSALLVSDFPTYQLASNWLLTEQVKSEKEIQDFIKIISRGSPIDLLDRELYED